MRFHKASEAAYLNFLRAKFERLTGETTVSSFPFVMGVESSSHCQLRCPFCPTGIENESRGSNDPFRYRSRSHLHPDVFDALLSELGEYLFLIMFYNWGEPLLNKNLPTLIRKAHDHDIATEIHTNLSLPLSDQFIEDLLTSGIDDLAASIDGFSQESYATYRRGGNFELAKSNMVRLAEARDRLGLGTTIVWNFLVFRWNEHEIESTRHFCKSLGVVFNPRVAFVMDDDWRPSDLKRNDGSKVTLKRVGDRPPLPPDQIGSSPQPKGTSGSCGWHYGYTMLNSDGAVSPCCAPWEDRHDFGKLELGATTFADVWNNERYQKARGLFSGKTDASLPKVETICDRCPWDAGVQNLYDSLDGAVIEQFSRVPCSDPILQHAVALLSDPENFVKFYREHFASGQLASEHDAESTSWNRMRHLLRTVPSGTTRARWLLRDFGARAGKSARRWLRRARRSLKKAA